MGKGKSIFDKLTEVKVSNSSDFKSRFEVVEDSIMAFSKADIKCITKCVILTCKSKVYKNTSMKLLVEVKVKGKVKQGFFKLDGKSYKRYKDNHGSTIDPTMVRIYDLYDPEEEYGSKDDHTWTVCRIKAGAITGTLDDDEDFFEKK